MGLEAMAQPPRQGQAQHPSSPAADVTRARRRLSEEGLLRSSPLLAADALPDPQPSSCSPCCPPITPRDPPVAFVADLLGTLRTQSRGRGCRAMAQQWPWSQRGRGPLGSVAWMYFLSLWWAEQLPWPWRKFRAALLGGLGICMIKERAEAAWAPFIFFFQAGRAQGRNAWDAARQCWEEQLKSLAPKAACCQLRLGLKFKLRF